MLFRGQGDRRVRVLSGGVDPDAAADVPARIVLDHTDRRLGWIKADGLDVAFMEQVVGNRSPIESPLMDAIRGWLGEQDPGAEAVPYVLAAFTDSRWFRMAFPGCAAYGFFPQRHQNLYETWPLMHSADERIDVRDLGFAAHCFVDLPRRLLG